ncbi:MAG: DUF2357 domain-containing protein [Bacilli bacterium]|nr:DUF2357 domain-containing protein [Bacilli bacterium]MDD4608260.1 DUF2357 domain-containing protein [Bacilli bacterium]
MEKESIVELLNNTEPEEIGAFLEQNDSNVKISSSYESVQFDYSWIDKIEETLEYLDNIIRNPRRFIAQEEEVVPVERAKKISMETIKHLAQHTNLIQDVSEDGTITPSKVLNIHKEESFDLYENRFIVSLLKNLTYFLQIRKEVSKQGSFSNCEKRMTFQGETKVNNEKININVDLSTKAFKDLRAKSSSGLGVEERIEKIEMIIQDFFKSQFIKEIINAAPVRSPIRKTNVILKNTDFQKALELWEFIERYDVLNKKEAKDSKNVENPGNIKNKMDMTFFLNYAILNSFEQEKIKRKNKLNKYYIKNILKKYMDGESNLTEKEFKKLLNDEFAKMKKKRVKFETKVITQLNNCVKKYNTAKSKAIAALK